MSFDSSLDPVGLAETSLLSVNVFTTVVPFSICVFRCWFYALHSPGLPAPGLPDVWVSRYITRQISYSLCESGCCAGCLDIVAFRRASPLRPRTRLTPLPVGDLGHVIAVLGNILLVFK